MTHATCPTDPRAVDSRLEDYDRVYGGLRGHRPSVGAALTPEYIALPLPPSVLM